MHPSQQNTVERCPNCRFSKPFDDKNYQCRRNAPISGMPENSYFVAWPIVFDDDWCGEFEPKPTAVPPWHTNGAKE